MVTAHGAAGLSLKTQSVQKLQYYVRAARWASVHRLQDSSGCSAVHFAKRAWRKSLSAQESSDTEVLVLVSQAMLTFHARRLLPANLDALDSLLCFLPAESDC